MEIVSVNYNTPDYIDRLITSIRQYYDYPIRIIDGSTEPYRQQLKDISNNRNVSLNLFDYNIHHGRGLHHAISTSTEDWVLCVDSEVQILQGMFECFKLKKPLEGFCCNVDQHGMNTPVGGITYLHPELLAVNVEWYNNQQFKFIHHGAPAIVIMGGCSADVKECMDEEHRKLYIRGGRGTVNRFGYNF